MQAARVERGKYKCNICKNIVPRSNITLDHVNPVVDPVIGFVDWNSFIERLFVDDPGWQAICKDPCHKAKTKSEGVVRRANKKIVKKRKKTVDKIKKKR